MSDIHPTPTQADLADGREGEHASLARSAGAGPGASPQRGRRRYRGGGARGGARRARGRGRTVLS